MSDRNRRQCGSIVLVLILVGTAASPSGAPGAAPVPSAAAQSAAAKQVSEIYGSKIVAARLPAQKSEIARELAKAASEIKDDPALRYVVYEKARELAISAGDDESADRIFEALAAEFDLGPDVDGLRRRLYEAVSKSAPDPYVRRRLAARLVGLSDAYLARDDYDGAIAAAHAGGEAFRAGLDAPGYQRATQRVQLLRTMKSAYDELRRQFSGALTAPADAGENTAAGRYYCFTKNCWSIGLPMLARGSDAELKRLALLEAEPPRTAEQFLALGEGWQAVAQRERGTAQEIARRRAAWVLRQALPQLAGLERARVEKQLAEFDAAASSMPIPVGDGFEGPVELLHKQGFGLSGKTGRVRKYVVVVPSSAVRDGTLEISVVNMGDDSGDGGMHCELIDGAGNRAFRGFGRSDRVFTHRAAPGSAWTIVLEDHDTGGGGNGGSISVWFKPS